MNILRTDIRLGIFLNMVIGILFIAAAVIVVLSVNYSMRQQALIEAQSKARIILDRNFATHTYFTQIMKPRIFAWSDPFRSEDYFDHTWMSSTYAIREIEKYFKSFNPSRYSFKDAAINARSPENEADEYERAFLEKLAIDKKLESESTIRNIGGEPYLVVLRKGETMEASCLRCHSHPRNAPKGLTEYYGSERSFNRKEGELISAVSLRIPLSEAYEAANIFSLKLSATLLSVLICIFIIQYWFYRRYLLEPLTVIQGKASQIATHEEHLGEQIFQPFGREWNQLTTAFNKMSVKLRHDRDHLKEIVDQRTEALQKEKYFAESLVRTAQTIILVLDATGHIVNFNPYMEEISGYPLKEVQGKDWFSTFLPERDQNQTRELFLKAIADIQINGNISSIVTKDGREIDIVWYDKTLKNEKGNVLGLLATGQDITERKKAEDQIKALLSEKELLLKEVHHRIKNNMAVIMSMLSLQAETLTDPSAASSLNDARSRLQSMMVLYDTLYRSADFRAISTKTYLPPLIDKIIGNFPNRELVTIETEIDDHVLSANTLSPLGIILNELLTNTMKHAFIGRKEGLLRVSFSVKDHHALLRIEDNGVGVPESVDIKTSPGFGMQLVGMLTEQIGGTIRIERQKGTHFILEFDV